ncbi:MAG: hypothetical protein BZY87_00135 [SAR202 cluster bacterium Io17-Chloro-G6]|nr:MAG: hypothetical protein BZY87_00135 [SAR202 cluster bacterium Io17-Chloro-G6]
MVGVAHRGNIPLEDIEVEFEVEPINRPNAIGFGVKELVTLKGRISESERVRLVRASQYCPVGQALTKGSMEVEDEVRWSTGETISASPAPEVLQPLEGDLTAIPFGSVIGRYLLDTKEHDETGAMVHEGQAKVSVRLENLTRSSRWTLLGGHSSEGWVPPPFPLAHGAWAASTVSTLSQLLPQCTEDAGDLGVELFMAAAGGGVGQSQANAAEGVVGRRQILRRITVPGTPSTTPLIAVQAALQRDPISLTYRNGGILLHHEVVVA